MEGGTEVSNAEKNRIPSRILKVFLRYDPIYEQKDGYENIQRNSYKNLGTSFQSRFEKL